MNGALAGGASLEEADWPYEKVVGAAAALPLLVALAPKRLGEGPEEDGALVAAAAGLLAPKVKVGLGAAGDSGERTRGCSRLDKPQHSSSSQLDVRKRLKCHQSSVPFYLDNLLTGCLYTGLGFVLSTCEFR